MKSTEIREKFCKFFESEKHVVLPGSSLIPSDPTVLLTLAGMLQFKPIFLGQEKPKYKRATTVQRCIRTNDIVQVGKTPRHHTFFEMLGNFSFGDYFKKEAIQFAWELLTEEFHLPPQKLFIAVFEKDEEAFALWRDVVGLPLDKIFRLGEENNFWAAGPTGPCGPCSEIYYDFGEKRGCGKPDCSPGCDCDRFLEIWNLVFIEYNRNEKGELIPLKSRGIDTGMGLERIASILQDVESNFETDLFTPLFEEIGRLPKESTVDPIAQRIIADHIRAVTHLIADGVRPSNEGRGYVLRRLIRRIVLYGKLSSIKLPFTVTLASLVVDMMGAVYPALVDNRESISQVLKEEEEGFIRTLDQGLHIFSGLLERFALHKEIHGQEAFKLHDTYGFPFEITRELAEKKGYRVDDKGFREEMDRQRERARKAGMEKEKQKWAALELDKITATKFLGYEKGKLDTKVAGIFPEQNVIVLEKTPFYAESGGQVGDTGILEVEKKEVRVLEAFSSPSGVILHVVDDVNGLKKGAKVAALIDDSRRTAITLHHTATHLLHRALREVLGIEVKQAGSYVGPDKLRFDFTHFTALEAGDVYRIEEIVNRKIVENLMVEIMQKSYSEALKMGAMALFGEKYGDHVRVVKIGDYSLELCGGTHAKTTGALQFFKVLSEGAVGAGVRRIEAVAGQVAKVTILYRAKSLRDEVEQLIKKYRLLQTEKAKLGGTKMLETNIFAIELTELERLAKAVDSQDAEGVRKFLAHLAGREEWLHERIAGAEKEIASLKLSQATSGAGDYLSEVKEINGVKVLLKSLPAYDMQNLRAISDALQGKLKSCILVLLSSLPDKVLFLATVTVDLIARGYSARQITEAFSPLIQGKGGGGEKKAEGGGKNIARVKEALDAAQKAIEQVK